MTRLRSSGRDRTPPLAARALPCPCFSCRRSYPLPWGFEVLTSVNALPLRKVRGGVTPPAGNARTENGRMARTNPTARKRTTHQDTGRPKRRAATPTTCGGGSRVNTHVKGLSDKFRQPLFCHDAIVLFGAVRFVLVERTFSARVISCRRSYPPLLTFRRGKAFADDPPSEAVKKGGG